jgi:hypothetical protein
VELSCSCTSDDGGIVNFDPACPLLATHPGSTKSLERAFVEDGLIGRPVEESFTVRLSFDPAAVAAQSEPTAHREARFEIYRLLQGLRVQMERWAEQRIKELKTV